MLGRCSDVGLRVTANAIAGSIPLGGFFLKSHSYRKTSMSWFRASLRTVYLESRLSLPTLPHVVRETEHNAALEGFVQDKNLVITYSWVHIIVITIHSLYLGIRLY